MNSQVPQQKLMRVKKVQIKDEQGWINQHIKGKVLFVYPTYCIAKDLDKPHKDDDKKLEGSWKDIIFRSNEFDFLVIQKLKERKEATFENAIEVVDKFIKFLKNDGGVFLSTFDMVYFPEFDDKLSKYIEDQAIIHFKGRALYRGKKIPIIPVPPKGGFEI